MIGVRVRLALLLVLLYAAASAARWVRRTMEWPARVGVDEISVYDRRLAALRPMLPEAGLVGYLGHPEPTGPTPRDSNAAALLHFRRYLLAQYALAPVLLIESTEPEVVVGNFDPALPRPPTHGLRTIRDFGDGLVVFGRTEP